MSFTAACCAEYPEGAEEGVVGCLGGFPSPEAEEGVAVVAFSFFFVEAAVGSLRLGLVPVMVLSLGVFS